MKTINVVTIGGGTGSHTVLKALKKIEGINIEALVTTADDGGVARKERDEFGLLPQSDVRKAILALAPEDEESTIRELFNYRFDRGVGLEGVTLGNLILTALSDIKGSQREAIEKIQSILDIKGKVIPITEDKTNILITLSDNKQIFGEASLDNVFWDGKKRIKNIELVPKAKIAKKAARAIKNADFIFITPGDLYGSVIVNFKTKGFDKAISQSNAKIVYTCNLFTKFGQTYEYDVKKHLKDIEKHLGKKADILVLNNGKYSYKSLIAYSREKANPVTYDLTKLGKYKVYVADLLVKEIYTEQKGDKLTRSLVRHDPGALEAVYKEILKPL